MAKINTKSELSKTDTKILIIVLVFVFAIVIGLVEYFYLFKPNSAKIEETTLALEGLQVRLSEAKKVPSQIAFYQREIDILEGKTTDDTGENDDTAELRQELDLPKILNIVETSATLSDMELTSIKLDGNAAYIKGGIVAAPSGTGNEVLDNNQNATGFYKLGIAMEIKAVSYEGLTNFLTAVEDAGYYITTASADLDFNKEQNVYSGKMNFYIYSFVSSSK